MSVNASQMYVGKKAAEPITEVKGGNRLTNNGMNRDRSDKNAVADEHDFASMRAGLKKTAPPPEK